MILRKMFIMGFILILSVCCAMAVTTTVWEQSSYKSFSDAKPKNISLTSTDEITLSRSLIAFDSSISEARIWCLAQDSKGNIYAGTGDKGKIFKINKEGQASLLFDSPETDIISLAIDSNDVIYAGSSPDGIIYKIMPDRIPENFFKSEEKYIWSLVFDKSGNLYAGTGIAGKLYKISPDGKGEVVCDSNDMHIKCLLRSGDNIYAGTEGSGIIYKISSDGKVFVLYDTSEKEISCMVMDARGNLYAIAVAGEAGPPGRESPEQVGPPPGRGREERKSIIYQITPDEVVTGIWESPDPLVFSIIADGEKLMVGTGDKGIIYSVKPDGDWASIVDCEESQVLSLYKTMDHGEIWLATGNPAKLYKLSPNYTTEGTLESQKWDASVTSRWGNISWDVIKTEKTNVTLATRSGNTEKPDDTWSNWSEEYTDPSGMQITSPPARFIQWRAKLTSVDGTSAPILKRISVSYLQRNLRPMIGPVTIAAEQEKGEGPPRMQQGAKGPEGDDPGQSEKIPLNGKKTIKWLARDPNGDPLEYSIYFRGVEEQNWKLLKDKVKSTTYQLDTESLPDDRYLLRVVATDSPANPKDIALSEEDISDAFSIDNTPPKIIELQAKPDKDGIYTISGKIEDAGSYVKSLIYSIDGEDWKPIFPSDQVFDSKSESFSFQTESLKKGEHTIVIKTTDAAGNTGAAKTVISDQ